MCKLGISVRGWSLFLYKIIPYINYSLVCLIFNEQGSPALSNDPVAVDIRSKD